MKKLITTIAVVAVASVMHAATVTWTTSAVTGPTGSSLSTTGYLFAHLQGSTDPSAATIIEALTSAYETAEATSVGTGVTAVQNYLANNAATTYVGNNGAYTLAAANKVDASTLGLVGGSTYDFFWVFTDSDPITSDTLFAVSKELTNKKVPTNSNNVGLAFGSQASYVGNANQWYAVPEPTSGLLMLLGVAGLALRRRRA